jgi:hypothetical protein
VPSSSALTAADGEAGLLTLSIVAEAHLGLAEADCVLSLANAIELLELGLVDTLEMKVSAASIRGYGAIRLSQLRSRTWLGK